jgi:hypothetical protein
MANTNIGSVARGDGFVACQQTGITLAAALRVDPGGLCLYNPFGSNVDAIIDWVEWHATVVFAAVSTIFLGFNSNPNAAAVTGTAATVRNRNVGHAATPACSALVAPTLPAVPVGAINLGAGLTGAVNLLPHDVPHVRYFTQPDGSPGLIVHPGCTISFQCIAASGTSGFWSEIAWRETAQTDPY